MRWVAPGPSVLASRCCTEAGLSDARWLAVPELGLRLACQRIGEQCLSCQAVHDKTVPHEMARSISFLVFNLLLIRLELTSSQSWVGVA